MKYFLFALILLFLPSISYASHQSTPCTITIQGEIIPVSYITESRGNPDNSFYPGDAFHYLFTFAGIPECASFSVYSILSEGIFDVVSHNSIMWNGMEQTHSHNDFEMQPKYLTTTHYYVDRINHCRNNNLDCSSIVLAESPSYSVREDQLPSSSLKRLLDGARTASTYSVRTEKTQDWGFTNTDDSHEHGEYLHINESDESINSFENYKVFDFE